MRPVLVASAIGALAVTGCGDRCVLDFCSPAIIVTTELDGPADAPLEGTLTLCHGGDCWTAPVALEPTENRAEIGFGSNVGSTARFAAPADVRTLEAEIHPATEAGFGPGDRYGVTLEETGGTALFDHEGTVPERLVSDACGPPCAIERVEP